MIYIIINAFNILFALLLNVLFYDSKHNVLLIYVLCFDECLIKFVKNKF